MLSCLLQKAQKPRQHTLALEHGRYVPRNIQQSGKQKSYMKLSNLNEWLSLGANLGVVIGIFFLVVEIQQNTESLDESRNLATAQAYQSRAQSFIDISLTVASTPELADLSGETRGNVVESIKNLSPEDIVRMNQVWHARRVTMDDIFYQYQNGYLDEEYYQYTFTTNIKAWAPIWEELGILGASRPSFITEIERILGRSIVL